MLLRAFQVVISKFRQDERGAILVEMTLITPLMISLSAGVFEFGNLVHQKLLIEAGLRDAARYAARCNPVFSGLACNAIAQNIAAYGGVAVGTTRVAGWAPGSVIVAYYDTANNTNADGTQDYRGGGPNIRTVRVTTSFNYTGVSLLAYLGLSPITLTGSHEERVIGW